MEDWTRRGSSRILFLSHHVGMPELHSQIEEIGQLSLDEPRMEDRKLEQKSVRKQKSDPHWLPSRAKNFWRFL